MNMFKKSFICQEINLIIPYGMRNTAHKSVLINPVIRQQ